MPNILVDDAGDWWEVLPESTYIPRDTETWVRYQDDAMRAHAAALVAAGATEEDAWAATYAQAGHGRVFIREVPHAGSSGTSRSAGPRGVYELIAFNGAGNRRGLVRGAMVRALVRPSGRWFTEQVAAAEQGIAVATEAAQAAQASLVEAEAAFTNAKTAAAKAAAMEQAATATRMKADAEQAAEQAADAKAANERALAALQASGKTEIALRDLRD